MVSIHHAANFDQEDVGSEHHENVNVAGEDAGENFEENLENQENYAATEFPFATIVALFYWFGDPWGPCGWGHLDLY